MGSVFLFSKQDRSVIELQRNADNDEGQSEVDEIKEYINARYIAPIEAGMHFGGVPIYVCMPPVRLLPCHLPGEQYISFYDRAEAQAIVNSGEPETELLAWFAFNTGQHLYGATHPAAPSEAELSNLALARQLTYVAFPRFFTFHEQTKVSGRGMYR